MTNLIGQTIGNWHVESWMNDAVGSFRATHTQTQQPGRVCVQSTNWLRAGCFEEGIQPYMLAQDVRILSVETYENIEDKWLVIQLPYFAEQDLVEQKIKSQDTFSLKETLTILAEVAASLDAGHARGLVHGNLTLGSILVDGRLLDWGLKHCLDRCSDPVVEAALPKLFFSYLSIEQIQGQKLNAAMERYTLAAITFEMLTGRGVYHSKDVLGFIVEYIRGDKHVPVVSISQENPTLPPLLDVVFERGLARNPDERFETAMAFVEAMASCI